jgi:hypothetical protein
MKSAPRAENYARALVFRNILTGLKSLPLSGENSHAISNSKYSFQHRAERRRNLVAQRFPASVASPGDSARRRLVLRFLALPEVLLPLA